MTRTAFILADTWDMHDWSTGGWIAMMLGMLIFWGLVIVGLVWVVRETSRGGRETEREDPLGLLDRRLAEGDISIEEYERRRAVLGR